MSLSVDTHPAKSVVNAPEFTITTTLTEGASYNNLRIRATVYIAGETSPIAVIEQPKGLDDWDFSELLKNYIGRLNTALGGSTLHIYPPMTAQLLTAWSSSGNFTTFTSSGTTISAADGADTGAEWALSNSLGALAIGDVLIVSTDYNFTVASGSTAPILALADGGSVENQFANLVLAANKTYPILVTDAKTSGQVAIGNAAGDVDFSGTFTIKKLTGLLNNPALYFRVKFEEIYEDGSAVTTTGDETWSDTLLYVPALIPAGETFDGDYLLASTSDKFLSKSSRYGVEHIIGVGMEHRIMYATDEAKIRTLDSEGGAGSVINNPGYGFVVINDNTIGTETSEFTFYLQSSRFTAYNSIAETLAVTISQKSFTDIGILTFLGDLGEETFIFKGQTAKTYTADKKKYRDNNGTRRTLNSQRQTQVTLRTGYLDTNKKRLLLELIDTVYPVYLIDSDLSDGYREVGVVTDNLRVTDGDEQISNEVTVEYYE